MSVDVKLYVNPLKWSTRDLVDLVTNQVKKTYDVEQLTPMKVDGLEDSVFLYYPSKNGPGMVMIIMADVGGFPARLISIGSGGKPSIKRKRGEFLKAIAERIGGMFMASDDDNSFEEFDDPFMNEYDFTLHSIQKNASHYEVLNNRRNEEVDVLVEELQKLKTES